MNIKKAIVLGIGLASLVVGTAFAVKPTPYKVICHHNPANDVELEFANEQSYNGHINGVEHNDQVYDTDGPCVVVTPTQEVTPTPEVTPEATPTVEVTPTVDVTPTGTPSATPTPTVTTNTVTNTVTTEKVVEKEVVIPAAAPATGRG